MSWPDKSPPKPDTGKLEKALESAPRSKTKPKKQTMSLGAFNSTIAPSGGKSAPSIWTTSPTKPWEDKPEDSQTAEQLFPALSPKLSTGPAPTFKPPTQSATWQAKPVTPLTPEKPPPDKEVERVKAKFAQWVQTEHGGCKALKLTETQIGELRDWAESLTTVSGKNQKFEVVRGAGTGEWAGSDQLKLINWYSGKIGSGKNATFHITLQL